MTDDAAYYRHQGIETANLWPAIVRLRTALNDPKVDIPPSHFSGFMLAIQTLEKIMRDRDPKTGSLVLWAVNPSCPAP